MIVRGHTADAARSAALVGGGTARAAPRASWHRVCQSRRGLPRERVRALLQAEDPELRGRHRRRQRRHLTPAAAAAAAATAAAATAASSSAAAATADGRAGGARARSRAARSCHSASGRAHCNRSCMPCAAPPSASCRARRAVTPAFRRAARRRPSRRAAPPRRRRRLPGARPPVPPRRPAARRPRETRGAPRLPARRSHWRGAAPQPHVALDSAGPDPQPIRPPGAPRADRGRRRAQAVGAEARRPPRGSVARSPPRA